MKHSLSDTLHLLGPALAPTLAGAALVLPAANGMREEPRAGSAS